MSTSIPSFTMLRQATVYAPESLGKCDVLLAGGTIAAIAETLPKIDPEFPVEEVDASGLKMIPGLIDAHAHLTGGGGESGFSTLNCTHYQLASSGGDEHDKFVNVFYI